MSTNLYLEAIAEAQQLKKLAEQNAKNKIIEALTPRIQAMVEAQLLSEQDDDIEVIAVEELPDEVDVESAPDELVAEPETAGDSASVVINSQGDVNLTVAEQKSSLKNQRVGSIGATTNKSNPSSVNGLAERNSRLRRKVRRMDVLLTEVKYSDLSPKQCAVIKRSYQKLLDEAITLRSEAIVSSGSKEKGLRLQIFETLKEMNQMTNRRSRAIFNRLFEDGYGELDEMELVLSDEDLEALGVEDAEEADVDALDLELVSDIGEEEEAEDAGEAEDEGEVEGEVEAAAEEEVALDLEEMHEVFEIDPRMLRRELSKLRRVREATEGSALASDEADQFGGGDIEDESFIDVDEDDLLNALADELGDPGVPAPTVESRRRRARQRARARMSERRSRASRSTTRKSARKAVAENVQLKRQLSEMNLFNAKLLYVNKLMQNRNVSSKQQRAIVEALDNAKTIREAKLVYESLSRSLKKSSLTEGKARRVLGSSSKPTRSSGSKITESAQTDRWAALAGIKKQTPINKEIISKGEIKNV